MGKLDDLLSAVSRSAPESKYIRAYHGSPHDFDRFDASKIGTGEGAQAYGHGLYFAGNEKVAGEYRRQLAGEPLPMDLAIDGSPVFRRDWQNLPPLHKDGTNYLMSRLRNHSDEYASEALGEIQKDLPGLLEDAKAAPPVGVDGDQWYRERYTRERRIRELEGAMELLRDRKVTVLPSERPGKTYEVEIGHPEDSLIDYDAPIGQQPKAISENSALLEMAADEARNSALQATTQGRSDHWWNIAKDPSQAPASLAIQAGRSRRPVGASRPPMSPREFSQYLLQSGVPGIRYLDGNSRRAMEGTRNYVMFPGTEDSIRILRKYGIMAPIAAGAMGEE
jgi:hypothetical protein